MTKPKNKRSDRYVTGLIAGVFNDEGPFLVWKHYRDEWMGDARFVKRDYAAVKSFIDTKVTANTVRSLLESADGS